MNAFPVCTAEQKYNNQQFKWVHHNVCYVCFKLEETYKHPKRIAFWLAGSSPPIISIDFIPSITKHTDFKCSRLSLSIRHN